MKRSLIYVLSLVVALSGCALKGNSRHIAVVGNVAVYQSLAAIQDTADTLRTTNVITQEQRQQIAKFLLPALQTGQAISKLTAQWPADKPAPAELQTLVNQLKILVDQILVAWPDSPGKAAIAAKIALAQQTVLALILVFTQQSGGA